MKAMDGRSAEPRRTDYEREERGGVGVLTCSGGAKPGGYGMMVRWTNAAIISIAVVSHQADLRSRVSGKDPLAY